MYRPAFFKTGGGGAQHPGGIRVYFGLGRDAEGVGGQGGGADGMAACTNQAAAFPRK